MWVDIEQIYSQHEKYILLEVEIPPESHNTSRGCATVHVNYLNIPNRSNDDLTEKLNVTFTNSKSIVEEKTNTNVMVKVVELIANEQNELALRLRDEGKIKEAKDLLSSNEQYLHSNATLYNSPHLREYEQQQVEDKMNMDERSWTRQRKVMRQRQFSSKMQQSK
ncbi:MAG: RNA-binding protein [Planctomycetota bacterium]